MIAVADWEKLVALVNAVGPGCVEFIVDDEAYDIEDITYNEDDDAIIVNLV